MKNGIIFISVSFMLLLFAGVLNANAFNAYQENNSTLFSLDGYFKLGSTYNISHDKPAMGQTDWRGLSRLRAELELEFNMKFTENWQAKISGKGFNDFAYALNGRSDYTDDVLDNYENEIELKETYISGKLFANLDIKSGRQIVVWGKSDTIRITDILNPLDNREPGLTDLEDLRLPLFMTKLDYYWGQWDISGIAIHEIRFDKLPEFGNDFYPYPGPLPPEDRLSDGGDNTEYAGALKGTFSGWDISFFGADVYWDWPYVKIVKKTLPPAVKLKHAKVVMLGSAFNVAVSNWIFKAEFARLDGLKYFNTGEEEFRRIDSLVGIEYYGFEDAVIIFEAANRHILGFDDVLRALPDQAQEDEFQWVLRLSRTFINETLDVEYLVSFYGDNGGDGKFQRFSSEYDINDSLKLIGGLLLYNSGDMPEFQNIGDNDRLYLELKYSF
jgi:hypothetical protein